jgi:hypothetical protein
MGRKNRSSLPKDRLTDPIPLRPVGYFANVYSKSELQEENRLAKASVLRPPKDLE